MRIVSLLPAATEILYQLDREPVGVTHECDFPSAAADKPAVTATHIDADAGSEAIADQVSAEGDGLYDIHRDRLAELDPDAIITQGICEVCAIEPAAVERAVADLGLDCSIVQIDVHGLEDLRAAIERIGEAIDRREKAATLVEHLDRRVAELEATASRAAGSPSVVVLDWLDPVMVAGHWLPEMVERLGGEYALESAGAQSRYREWEQVHRYDPDVLVLAPCGFDVAQATENLSDVSGRPGWDDLTAVRDGRAFVMDGSAYVNRPGPRLVDTMAYLGWTMYPDAFEEPPADAIRPVTAELVK